MKTCSLFIAAVFIIILSPSTAHAGWKTERSLAIATQVTEPTCGALVLAIIKPDPTLAPGQIIAGWAEQGNCTIAVTPEVARGPFERLCSVVLHEAMHVRGYWHPVGAPVYDAKGNVVARDHSHSPHHKSIMSWYRERPDRRCRNRGRNFLGMI